MERLLDYFEPQDYLLKLDINKKTKNISGLVQINGIVKKSTIKLHATDFKNLSVKINDKSFQFDYDGMIITIKDVQLGNNHVEIEFSHKLNENMEGAYLSTYEHKGKIESIVTTQFESHYAREAFPCIDEPAAKATFNLAIKTDDPEDLVLANTPKKTERDGYIIFDTTPKMSTYLLAFVIGKFHGKTIKNSHGVEITTYAPLNQPLDSVDFANEVAAKSLEYYDDNFNIPYPLPKCDQVAIPDFEAGAMENWGLVTYRESMLLADKTASLDTKKTIALTVSHELSHQWFGDLVTMAWWDDLWLNESFASVMEYFATDFIYPEFNIWEDFFTGDCLAALNRDAFTDVQSVHQAVEDPAEIATLFDGAIVYAKGARLMLMLIRMMGWQNFKKGLRDYFKKYAYKNTIGDNLWDTLNSCTDFDVKDFMNYWIKTPGYPVLTEGHQERFLIDSSSNGAFSAYPIPEVRTDMSGHYLIDLSDEDLAKKLQCFSKYNLEEKLRLLIDRELTAKTLLAESNYLIDLVWQCRHEKSAAIWNIVIRMINDLKIFFNPDSEEEKLFKEFVRKLVSDKLDELGIVTRESDDGNTISLRASLLALIYYAEDSGKLKRLAELYDNDYSKMDPEIRFNILNAKLYLEPKLFSQYLQGYQLTTDPEIRSDLLFAMTLSKNENNLNELISLLNRPEIIKPQDHLHLYIYLFRNSKSQVKTFQWLTENWQYVLSLSGEKTIADYPRYTASAIRTEEMAEKFSDFFSGKREEIALSRTLKVAEKEISARLELIRTDKKAVYDRLKNL